MTSGSTQHHRDADRLEPLATRPFSTAVAGLRAMLRDARAADPSIPRVYALLQRAGGASVPCHLVMVRHLAAINRLEDAARLATAVTLTDDWSTDAWRARAQVAAARGRHLEAAECHAELLARELPARLREHRK